MNAQSERLLASAEAGDMKYDAFPLPRGLMALAAGATDKDAQRQRLLVEALALGDIGAARAAVAEGADIAAPFWVQGGPRGPIELGRAIQWHSPAPCAAAFEDHALAFSYGLDLFYKTAEDSRRLFSFFAFPLLFKADRCLRLLRERHNEDNNLDRVAGVLANGGGRVPFHMLKRQSRPRFSGRASRIEKRAESDRLIAETTSDRRPLFSERRLLANFAGAAA